MASLSLPLALLIITAALGVMMLAIIWSLRRCGLPGVRDWCETNLVAAGAMSLIALRGTLPDMVTLLVANLALAWAMVRFYVGTVRFCGGTPRWNLLVPAMVAMAAAITYWRYVDDVFAYRVAVVSAMHGALCVLTGLTLLRHRPRGEASYGVSYYLTTAVFALGAGVGHGARGVLSVAEVIEYGEGIASPGLNVAFLTLGALVMPALTMGAVLMIHDAMVRRLEAIANTDALTGVMSRKAWEDVARRELSRAVSGGGAPSVLIIDIDHFKSVNDTWGHAAGDAVLQAFAGMAQLQLRPGDWLGRMGGEEFVVMLPRTTATQAAAVADRIRRGAETGKPINGVRYTLSAGVATWGDGEDLDEVKARADAALYGAKVSGRNRVQLASDMLSDALHARVVA